MPLLSPVKCVRRRPAVRVRDNHANELVSCGGAFAKHFATLLRTPYLDSDPHSGGPDSGMFLATPR